VGVDFSLLKEVERINKSRVHRLLEKARKALWVLKEKQIGILGLAYKASTDDIRYAPALDLIQILLTEEARVRAYDAKATEKTRAIFPSVAYAQNPYEVADGADALFIATEWQEFRDLDWSRVRDSMARPLVVDGRNLLDPQKMKALGFEYLSMGRPD
jgi:UDPglucose 6-dehydrogenase